MSAAKIASFYDDPVKRACDKRALHDSEYRRSISIETTPRWQLHRARILATETVRGWGGRRLTVAHPRVATDPTHASLVPG